MSFTDRRTPAVRLLCGLALSLAGLMSLPAAAQSDGKAPWNSYGDRIKGSQEVSPLGPDLFGDQISLSNGGLSFTATDVSIPGNSSLPMALTRRYQVKDWRHRPKAQGMLKDWDLDLPNVSATFATEWVGQHFSTGVITSGRCSTPNRPPLPTSYEGLAWEDFWHGVQINIPGVTSGELLRQKAGGTTPSSGGPYLWMTNDQVHVSCLPTIKNGTGAYGNGDEGFLAITPDGTKYWFDWMARTDEPPLKRGSFVTMHSRPGPMYWTQVLPIYRYSLYATRIEDRFGNVVELTYSNTWDKPARLTSIRDASGGEGRQISIDYTGDAISSVNDGTRTWNYSYGTTGSGRGTLTKVQQSTPDNLNSNVWAINFAEFTNAEIIYPEANTGDARNCFMLQDPSNYSLAPVGTITHPSGAVGTFTMKLKEHNRSNVPVNCNNIVIYEGAVGNDENDDTPRYPFSYISLTLDSKVISGPNLPTAYEWTYSYDSDRVDLLIRGASQSNPRCTLPLQSECMKVECVTEDCAGRSRTIVRGPNDEWTHYSHGNSYRYNEGKLLVVDVGVGPGPTYLAVQPNELPKKVVTNSLQRTTTSYDLSRTAQSEPTNWGASWQLGGDGFQDEYRRPWTGTVTRLQNVDFSRQATALDAFDRPITEVKANVGGSGSSRTDTTEYHDNLGLWVIGQVARTTVNGVQTARTEFSPLAQPVEHRGMGNWLIQEISYHANGVPHTIKDGKGNTTAATGWYRGIPQLITYADATTQSAAVNALGWITQITDQENNETNYEYDSTGRLKLIRHPAGGSVAWNNTQIRFSKLTGEELDFPAGTWVLQTQTGDGYKRTYFDEMWRPRLTHEYDSGDMAGTQRFNAWAYDSNGRTTFAAYPLAAADGLASFGDGVWTEYDRLGRVTSVTQNSEIGSLTTLTEYLSGFKIRVTNPRGKATTTSFLAWDQPDTSMPRLIEAPAGVTTTITRDGIGRPTQITRAGTWSGAAISANRYYRYNTKGQLERSLSSEERSTYFDYDLAGNVLHTYHCGDNNDAGCGWTSAGARPADRTTMTYDSMNRVTLVDYPTGTDDVTTTYHDDGSVATVVMGIVTREFEYNNRGMLANEWLKWNANSWWATYGYNANGHQATLTYRDGHQVSFAPNALGQATQAGTYATNATYFPNGALKQFTYGNGVLHTLTQNARQLPERSLDMFGATKILDDTYDYDQNGNVAGISDGLSAQPGNRDMVYDDLDRLIGVTAGSAQGGNAVFAYDVLDNIRQLDQGTRTVRHQYDGPNRLSSIKNAAGTTVSTYTHDTRGNLIQRVTGAVTDTFTFDKANRLKGTTIGGVVSTYRYDGLGRRMQQVEGGQSSYFQYGQSGQLLFSHDALNRYTHVYLAGSLVAKRVVPFDGSASSVRFQHTDALGTPVAETNETGVLTRRERMTAYGEPADGTWQSGPGYTGHQMDAGAKLVYMQQRYYDPAIGRFLSADPVKTEASSGALFNRYWYANDNPYRFSDPDGRIPVETAWDAANVTMGAASAYDNFSSGNVGAGVVDVVGVIADVAATLTPYVPGGAATVIKGARGVDAAVGAAKAAPDSSVAGAGADFIVTPGGTAVPTSQSRMESGLEAAGIQGTSLPDGAGTSYDLPGGTTVRAMEPSGQAPRRASFNNSNGGPVTPDGTVPQPPRGASAAERREYVRERTHVEQKK